MALSASKPISCAVVGLRQGLQAVYVLLNHPGFALKAVCNPSAEPVGWITGTADPKKSQNDYVHLPPVSHLLTHLRASPGAQAVEHILRYDELLTRSDIEAVLLFVPDALHVEYSIAALRAGKRVLCTKPMGLTPQSAQTVAEEARKRSGSYMVGFHFTCSAFAKAVQEEIARGAIGTVRQMSFHFDRGQFRPVNRVKSVSGGPIVQECCHWFDLFYLLSGKARFSKVAGFGGNDLHTATQDVDDNGSLVIEYENHVRAALLFTYFRPFKPPELFTLVGDRGRIRGSFDRLVIDDPNGERTVPIAGNKKLPGIFHEGFFEMADAFAEMIRSNRDPYSNWEAGLENAILSECAQRSLETGEVVRRQAIPPG